MFLNPAALHVLVLAAVWGATASRAADAPLAVGGTVSMNGLQARLAALETLPFVAGDYTRRHRFDSFDNPKLHELRTRYRLDDVVRPGRDEFERQLLLMNWVHEQFRKFGQPSTNARGALEILRGIEGGHTFFCSQYVQLLVSAAASLGWIDRPLALRRHQGVNKVGGSTEHAVTEMWSNQHRKWIMLDPTSNLHLEAAGVPLNAFEIREEWFYRHGTNLTFVVGRDRTRYRKSDLPIVLKRFPGFGDLAVHPDELDKYGFIGYIPNTDLMDGGLDYGKMFIVKDALCDGTRWHVRVNPENPRLDPYFPIHQAELRLFAGADGIEVALRTLTPNFDRYEARRDGARWERCDEKFLWHLRPGRNRLEARSVNRFGVSGPVSSATIDAAETTGR